MLKRYPFYCSSAVLSVCSFPAAVAQQQQYATFSIYFAFYVISKISINLFSLSTKMGIPERGNKY